MEMVIVFLLALTASAVVVFFILLVVEPPSTNQRVRDTKRTIEQEKERRIAEIDALAEAHDKQVFEVISQAAQQVVKEQVKQARRQTNEVLAQAAKEN